MSIDGSIGLTDKGTVLISFYTMFQEKPIALNMEWTPEMVRDFILQLEDAAKKAEELKKGEAQ